MLSKIGKYLIEIYWSKIPASERRVCIHKVSCSVAVHESLDKYGFFIGLKLYLQRRKTCNGSYIITKKDDAVIIKTRSGQVLQENEINPVIVKEFKTSP